MSGELPAYQQDIRWFHGELSRRGVTKTKEGDGSAFAERVAIKLDGACLPALVNAARLEALEEFLQAKS